MIPFSSRQVKKELRGANLAPKKHLGQNFLVDPRILQKILAAADVKPTDAVLEVGPGLGVLTKALAKRAKLVVAVEKDRELARMLEGSTAGMKNIKVMHGDILKVSDLGFRASDFKLIANLPYYITSPVIRKFLEARHKPKLMVLMVQKEVAQRICAKPPNMNLLAVSVRYYGTPAIVSYVKRISFWPQPGVDSAIIKVVPKKHSVQKIHDREFFEIVKAGFRHPRKQLISNLSKGLAKDRKIVEATLQKTGIQPSQRAETLSLHQWIALAKGFDTSA